ncbi:MAG: hypothetical protein IT426_17305 [Pirellulales bacterium]|nr:hypothetical protein [Pirellulales bacterium]
MIDALPYPRVLIVNGASLGPDSAAGLTMSHLFAGWPRERIAQIYGEPNPPDPGICPRCRRISAEDVPADRLARKLFRRNLDRVFGVPSAGLPPGIGATSTLGQPPPRNRLRNIASAWADLLAYRLSADFWAWIEEFQPQVLYGMLGSIRAMRLTLRIARRFDLPIVPHIMDDWPATHYRSSIATSPSRQVMLSRLRAVFRRSPLGLTISDAMAEEYRRRYGIRFEGFMNCVDIAPQCPPPPERGPEEPLRFAFIGGLHYNRWQSLCDIGRVLIELRAEGFSAILDIYAPKRDIDQYGPALRELDCIRIRENFRTDELPAALSRSDAMVHVESFDDIARQYFRISLSTKVPLYLAAGRPILAYGPGEINTCRYLAACNAGFVVGSRDPAALRAAIRQLCSSADLRRECGRRAWEQARLRHDEKIVRERFRGLLLEAAERA